MDISKTFAQYIFLQHAKHPRNSKNTRLRKKKGSQTAYPGKAPQENWLAEIGRNSADVKESYR